eukprot:scaffold8600_cov48-Phaeocystis_antarctica.AAC.1
MGRRYDTRLAGAPRARSSPGLRRPRRHRWCPHRRSCTAARQGPPPRGDWLRPTWSHTLVEQ